MPPHPQSKAAAAPVARGTTLLELADQAGHLVPVGRGGERRAIALANPSLGGTPVRDPDAVGRDPVPHARRGRPRAPAHPERVPLRRRGRGRVDRRRGRPGADAPRRLPAAGRLELARPPQRRDHADGVDRRPRHPVPVRRSRRSSSTSAATRSATRSDATPERSRSERLWGHPGLRAGVAARRARPARPLLAYRWEHTDRALTDQLELEARGLRRDRRARPRAGPLHQPDQRRRRAAHDPHRVPPRSSAARETAPRREVGSSVYQVFDGSGTVTVGDSSVERHPRRPVRRPVLAAARRSAPRPAHRLRLRRARPVPVQRRARSSRRSTSTARPVEDRRTDEARHHPHCPTGSTRAVRVDGDTLVDLGAADLGELCSRPTTGSSRAAAATGHDARSPRCRLRARWCPSPRKVVCVGLNYRNHILEMGRDLPEYPTLFCEVRRHPDRRPRRHPPPGRDRRVRLGGRARGRHRDARSAAPTTARGRGRDRRLHRAQRHHLPRLAVPHPRVAAGQELGLHHPGRPVPGHPGRAPRRRAPDPRRAPARSTAS